MDDEQPSPSEGTNATISGTYRLYSDPDEPVSCYDLNRESFVAVQPDNEIQAQFQNLSQGNVITATLSDIPEDNTWRVTEFESVSDSRLAYRAVNGYVPAIALEAWNDRSQGHSAGHQRVTDSDGQTVAEFKTYSQDHEEYGDLWTEFNAGRLHLEGFFSDTQTFPEGVHDIYFLNPLDRPFVVLGLFPEYGEEYDRFASHVDKATDDDPDAGTNRNQETKSAQADQAIETFEFDWQDSTDVSFDDVGGMEAVKNELRTDVIQPLTVDREKAKEFGIPLPNVLLYGPPGTGKTYLAKALASELSLPVVLLSASDVTSRYINASSERIGRLFDEARAKAEDVGGAVVFLDELDAVLSTRGGSSSQSEDRKVVNEFLSHIQEVSQQDVLFVGATNKRNDLDEAAVRSGRIDKEIYVGLPDLEARQAIIKAQLKDRPHDLDAADLETLAHETEDFTAADLASLVEDAARHALFTREGDQIESRDFDANLPKHNATHGSG